jgi:hypothetical protein
MSEDPHAHEVSAEQAAHEAELAAMTSTDMMLQTTVLLLNIGGRRLGLAPPSASEEERAAANADRDLEQVRDSIDAVRALLEVLERRLAGELRPLRDALSQLQMAYAREVQSSGAGPAATAVSREQVAQHQGEPESADAGTHREEPGAREAQPGAPGRDTGATQEQGQRRPGPAESSGRLWVPGR